MEKYLAVLESEVVSLSQQLKILGGGELEQTCFSCGVKFSLASVLAADLAAGKTMMRMVAVKCYETGTNMFACSTRCRQPLTAFWGSLTLYMGQQVQGVGRDRICDSCHLAMVTGQRCSGCKTKVYCTQECHVRDWGKHSKVCSLLKQEERKRKPPAGPLPEPIPGADPGCCIA